MEVITNNSRPADIDPPPPKFISSSQHYWHGSLLLLYILGDSLPDTKVHFVLVFQASFYLG